MDVYRSRHKPRPGAISRHVRLSLLPEEWRTLEERAARMEEGMAYTITCILALYTLQVREGQDRIDAMGLSQAANREDSPILYPERASR